MPSQQRGMRHGPGDIVKDYYDATLIGIGKKSWRGAQTVGASGFGKGLMLGALFVVAATMFTFGFGAYSGMLTAPGALTLGEGIKAGFSLGLHALFSDLGLAAVAAAGALGMMSDRRKAMTKLSAADAAKLPEAYALMRQSPQKQPVIEQEMNTPERSFRAEEMDRRARAAGASQLRQGYGPG